MTTPRAPEWAPSMALGPELARLVERAALARLDEVESGRPGALGELVLGARVRGELTAAQAVALSAVLGLAPANDRA